MLKREIYLKKIRGFYDDTTLIKIIYGMRRSGKSILLKQIMDELIKKNIKEENIIYINMELVKYDFLNNYMDLNNYIENLKINNDIYYVFIDEIDKIENFEKTINSLRVSDSYSIFIAGSNSKMTFNELSTDLTGRYVSFKVKPLSFNEIVKLKNVNTDKYIELLQDIFKWGSLPQRFKYDNEDEKINYISSVYDSIILKDVIERLKVKDITTFNKIFQYILEIETREFSVENVSEFLKREHHSISNETLYEYLDALTKVFILDKVYRYDIKGKNILKTLSKYYVADLGIKNIKCTNLEINYSVALENIVYNNLIYLGYTVYVGKTAKGEIDFVATKMNEVKLIQVTYKMDNDETIRREFEAFKNLDYKEKYIITLEENVESKDDVKVINLFDFLLNENF